MNGLVAVFPVYAGVILQDIDVEKELNGVPRVCGGDPLYSYSLCRHHLVFPVYAGVIPILGVVSVPKDGVPRVCGGDPV